MSDTMTIVEGLLRLAASLDGLPLLGGKGKPGVFPSHAAGRQAAEHCLEQQLIRCCRQTTQSRKSIDYYTLTQTGRVWLWEHSGPRAILDRLVGTLEAQASSLSELKHEVEKQWTRHEELRVAVLGALEKLVKEPHDPRLPLIGQAEILAELHDWQIEHPLKDCALPEAYARVSRRLPHWSVGQFHDACRALLARGRIYLHPWTGPLYEMPEPGLALLSGHEIAYYASLREPVNGDAAPAETYETANTHAARHAGANAPARR